MIKVLVLGASGMLGSMITDVLSHDDNLSITATVRGEEDLAKGRELLPSVEWKQFSVTESEQAEALNIADYTWVVNAIGITKPLIRDDNAFEVERALRVNSLFPYFLASRAQAAGAGVLQIATDCVYSGLKGAYVESDNHDALDVYGKTKSLGEVVKPCMHHIRCSIIGPEPKEFKFLLEWFRRQPLHALVNGYINHRWNGVTTLHFAKVIHGIIKNNLVMPLLQHLVPTGDLTKAEMIKVFARVFDRQDIEIKGSTASQIIDRTLSTNQPDLNLHLWRMAGYEIPPTVTEMIVELGKYQFRLVG